MAKTKTTPDINEVLAKITALEARSVQFEEMLKRRTLDVGGGSYFEDGPFAPDKFIFDGKIATLSAEQFRMIDALWHEDDLSMDSIALALAVWGDEERSLRKVKDNLNKALADAGIRFTVSKSGPEHILH